VIDQTTELEQLDTSPRRPLDTRRLLVWALFALPLVVLLVRAWQYRWMSDDGFINLRVVRQLQAGHGPVFNQGERVEASTSPLWVGVLAVADYALPLSLEWIAVVLGIAMTVVGVGFLLWGSTNLSPASSDRSIAIPTGIWVLAAIAPSWKFASSGLENGLFVLWFGAAFVLLTRWITETRATPGVGAAVVVGLGPLVRPDLALLSGALLLAVVLSAQASWWARVRFLAVALAVPVAYQLFRMGYYDSLTPNTAAAKEAGRSWWSQGFHYLRVAGQPYWLWLPLIVLAVGAYVPLLRRGAHDLDRRLLAIVIACAAGGTAHLLYVARVGGDFMHARMALPGLTAIIAPVAVSRIERRIVPALTAIVVCGWALVALVFLRSPEDGSVTFIGTRPHAITVADYGFQPGGAGRQFLTGPGVYFGDVRVHAPTRAGLPPVVVASYGVGISSYALGTDAYVLDMLGLGDAFTSHLKLARRGVVAHEKPLPHPWVAARLIAPDTHLTEADFPMKPFFIARPLDHPVGTFDERVAAARKALTCGRLRAFDDRIRGSLSAGRFLGNIVHSFDDTRLRIAPEPADAVRQFCTH
jgi:arabinofuranosyltransferase